MVKLYVYITLTNAFVEGLWKTRDSSILMIQEYEMSDIFLSYNNEDKAKAQIIVNALEEKGYTLWWDRNIPIGKQFDEFIQEKLEAAKCVVVLWSRKSIKSVWVKDEAREGKEKEILIPVLIENVKPPLGYRGMQASKLMDWDGMLPNQEFDMLLKSVAEKVGRPPAQKKNIKKRAKSVVVGSNHETALTAATSTGTVTRSFSGTVATGRPLTVTLKPGGAVSTGGFYSVIETLPAGFTFVSSTTDSTQSGQTITFTKLGGTAFTYRVTAPAASPDAVFTFSGTFQDADRNTGTVSGSSVLTVGIASSGQNRIYITSDNPSAQPSWDAQSFAGFFYDIKYNRQTEKLYITNTMAQLEAARTIEKEKLWYTTKKAEVEFKVKEKENKSVLGKTTYPVVGWRAEKWVAVNGKANKLAKLVYEMGKEDKKTFTTGETWTLGAGYELVINALDARATPRQVWFTLKKDGAVVDEGISDEKNVFTKTMTIQGETDSLLFAVYVDRIFSEATSDMAQFKYAWLIDASSSMEIKSADKFGVFEVRKATGDVIELSNENSVSLTKNSESTILGDIKFIIGDSNELRFYPKVDYV